MQTKLGIAGQDRQNWRAGHSTHLHELGQVVKELSIRQGADPLDSHTPHLLVWEAVKQTPAL